MQYATSKLLSPATLLLLAGLFATSGARAEAPVRSVEFDRDIRPILSDKCFLCHGPDAGSRAADLRLDTRAGATEYVVVPGAPDDSELVSRIFSDDEEYRMPPPSSHLALSTDQKNLLRRWIAEGAKYSQHWAFKPLPRQVPVPDHRASQWPRTELDKFVLARLDEESLAPSPPAAPLRLLRRLSFDLTGLPPTIDEIRKFELQLQTDRESAFTDTVERLLASPAYGEHMAVAWLDAARYADSHGYQSDQLNTQWPYRDWVVRAFNENLPYDDFVTWQLAGDLLSNPTTEQILATAFNRLHRMTNEGGSIAEEWLAENAADRVHTFGTAMLGLTMECCRCHDHKYDPISQRDYYSMSAFFNSIDENGLYDRSDKVPSPSILLPTEEQDAELAAAAEAVQAAERDLNRTVQNGNEQFREWLEDASNNRTEGGHPPDQTVHLTFEEQLYENEKKSSQGNDVKIAAHAKRVPGVVGQAVQFDGDHGVVLTDVFHIDRWDAFSLDFWIRDTARNPLPVVILHRTRGMDVGYNGFDVMLEDGIVNVRLYRVWPGNALGVRSVEPLVANEWQHLAVTYDGSSSAAGLRIYLNGQEVQTEIARDHVVKSVAQVGNGDGYFTLGERFRDRGFRGGEMDELRVFERALAPLEVAHLHDGHALPTAIEESANHVDEIREYYFSAIDTRARRQQVQLREARKALVNTEEPIQEVSVMEELDQPRTTYVLARGAYDAPEDESNRVGRDVFREILPPLPHDAPRNRLGLAQWLTDPSHPLTARVFVNRIWMNFFGRGLVATPENFGRQGEAPSHPELLDWLARDFVDHDWDVKRLCRQIVLSATYQQDSRLRPEFLTKDPENRLLARGPSGRLAAEQIRDLALAASRLLVSQTGGPPVSPYQPGKDLWRESNDMSPPYEQSTTQGLYRRSLYSVWKRTAPLPNMLSFDTPTREVCVVTRSRTNTPLQALVLLNDVQFVEAARVLAADVARCCDTTEARIAEAFMRLTGRSPDAVEIQQLCDLNREQKLGFSAGGEDDPNKLIEAGDSAVESELAPAELAALTVTCQAILNLDASIYNR
jgi:hypothetical protein